jgi:hypothetical protein
MGTSLKISRVTIISGQSIIRKQQMIKTATIMTYIRYNDISDKSIYYILFYYDTHLVTLVLELLTFVIVFSARTCHTPCNIAALVGLFLFLRFQQE